MSELLVVNPDATCRFIPNNDHAALRAVFPDNGFDFAGGLRVGAFVDDEGLLEGNVFNVIASLFVGRPLYGPAVLAAPHPDDEGYTVALDDDTHNAIRTAAEFWRNVRAGAAYIGQDIDVRADQSTLPPPVVISLPDDWSPGDPFPGHVGPVFYDEKGDPL